MISGAPEPATGEEETGPKAPWAEPVVTKLDLGDAEAGDGSGPDGGLAS